MNPRSEPLLWLQLIALGALPLELLLLVLVLAGADPGPFPALERLLAWALGGLAPGALFWRRPPDCCSLLLVQVPVAGRTVLQRRLTAMPLPWWLRSALPFAIGLLLVLLWRLDGLSVVATSLSPLQDAPRLVSLLLAAGVLALMLWQTLQLLQAIWLLSRPAAAVEAGLSSPLAPAAQRLSLGLPLLLLQPLTMKALAEAAVSPPAMSAHQAAAETLEAADQPAAADSSAPPDRSVSDLTAAGPSPVAIEPEQAPEDDNGSDLDQQIAGGDGFT